MKKFIVFLVILLCASTASAQFNSPLSSGHTSNLPSVSLSNLWDKYFGKRGPSYDFRDEFTTTLSAGSVNGSAAEPGVGVRSLSDASNDVSIASGKLTLGGAAASYLYYPAITRTAGKLGVWQINPTDATNTLEFGWDSNNSGAIAGQGYRITGDTLKPYPGGTAGPTLFVPVDGTDYTFVSALRGTGAQFFGKGGTLGRWSLLWVGATDNTGTLYPAISNTNLAGTFSYVRFPAQRYLATPLVNDGFTTAFGTSDGAGIAETTGLGSGGSGVVWTGPTWSISSGKAVNTPTEGSNIVVNGDFSSSTGWTNVPPFDISSGVATGTLASGELSRTDAIAGTWYKSSWDLVSRTAGSISLQNPLGDGIYKTSPNTYIATGRAATTRSVYFYASGFSGVIDNAFDYPLTLSTLFATHSTSTANIVQSADLINTAGTQVGLSARLNSQSNPTAGIVAYTDGTNCKVDYFTTATTWTNAISAACTYSASATMTLILDSTAVRLYYNNALIGTATIDNAAINTNTYHGLFSTSSSNSADNYVLYPRGNEGQFDSFLNQFISAGPAGVTNTYALNEDGSRILNEDGTFALTEG